MAAFARRPVAGSVSSMKILRFNGIFKKTEVSVVTRGFLRDLIFIATVVMKVYCQLKPNKYYSRCTGAQNSKSRKTFSLRHL